MNIEGHEVTFDDGTTFRLPSWTPPEVVKQFQGPWHRPLAWSSIHKSYVPNWLDNDPHARKD